MARFPSSLKFTPRGQPKTWGTVTPRLQASVVVAVYKMSPKHFPIVGHEIGDFVPPLLTHQEPQGGIDHKVEFEIESPEEGQKSETSVHLHVFQIPWTAKHFLNGKPMVNVGPEVWEST